MLDLASDTPERSVAIPPAHTETFRNGIVHPTLWLWDSWVDAREDRIDLYCLALARRCADGNAIWPGDRNAFPFHVRRFRSADGGETWLDRGCFFAPTVAGDGSFARSVWSGSAISLDHGRTLHALTGLRALEPSRPFIQALLLAEADDDADAISPPTEALLCPVRDFQQIRAAGYYLGPRADLGTLEGEEGGPILAWRDPFLWRDEDAQLHMLWSAKASANEACVGHAVLERDRSGIWGAALQPPIRLPLGEAITQAEVPKVYASSNGEGLYLLISGCNRRRETQPDHEVVKSHNLYRSETLRGPWRPHAASSVLAVGKPFLYGGSFLEKHIGPPAARFVAPYTEHAEPDLQLTFERVQLVALDREADASSDA